MYCATPNHTHTARMVTCAQRFPAGNKQGAYLPVRALARGREGINPVRLAVARGIDAVVNLARLETRGVRLAERAPRRNHCRTHS